MPSPIGPMPPQTPSPPAFPPAAIAEASPGAPVATWAPRAPARGWYSAVRLDPTVQPRPRSALPGYATSAEQCGEFVFRYFRSQGKGYPTLGQPYAFLLTGRDHLGAPRPQFKRYKNHGAEPPRAGDILVCKGPKPGQFHTAIVERVDGRGIHLFQANVPLNWQGGKQVHAVYPLTYREGVFTIPPLPTREAGYRNDYAVAGWIRPTGRDVLPRE